MNGELCSRVVGEGFEITPGDVAEVLYLQRSDTCMECGGDMEFSPYQEENDWTVVHGDVVCKTNGCDYHSDDEEVVVKDF